MKKKEIKTDWDLYGSYARRAIAPMQRMQMQRILWESVMRSPISTMIPRPISYEPRPFWHNDLGASERRVKELLSVSESFDPIWVDYEDKTAFFDESEKLIPTPKKRVWYHQTPQIRGRTFGFIFRE